MSSWWKKGIGGEGARVILTFPGVPYELKTMWQETAKLYFSVKQKTSFIYSEELKHIGIGESALAELHSGLLDGANPTVAPYAGWGECRLRVTAKAETAEHAKQLVVPVVDEIVKRSGEFYYGKNEEKLESVLGKLLTQKGLTLTLAESCTGGWISKRLTDIAGSSEYIKVNLVTYCNEAKHDYLSVSNEILTTHGAVSKECAEAMAKGIRAHNKCDIGVGVTGIAGPGGGNEEKPVGLVYLGLNSEKGACTKKLTLGHMATRNDIRYRAVNACLNMIRLFILRNY